MLTEVEYDAVYNFLQHHRYPDGFDKAQKRALRRKANDHFRVSKGLLLYCRKKTATSRGEPRAWKQVPRSAADRLRILETCHASVEGNTDTRPIVN